MTQSAPPQDAVSIRTEEFLVDTPAALTIDVPGAILTIRPSSQPDRTTLDLSMTGGAADEADRLLDQMGIDATLDGDTVRIESTIDRSNAAWWRWIRQLDVTLHIDLCVPSPVNVDLNVPGGAVDIAGLEGHFDLDVMGGPCHLQNLVGSLTLQAESSDVSIDQVSGEELLAQVAVGRLALTDVQMNTITLRSVSAPVSLTNIEGLTTITANSTSVALTDLDGPCTAESQGGPLTYEGTPTAETNLSVVGDALTVCLPPNHAADLRMAGPDLSLSEAFSFDGKQTNQTIEGTLNDGGPPLTLRNIGGTAECTTGSAS